VPHQYAAFIGIKPGQHDEETPWPVSAHTATGLWDHALNSLSRSSHAFLCRLLSVLFDESTKASQVERDDDKRFPLARDPGLIQQFRKVRFRWKPRNFIKLPLLFLKCHHTKHSLRGKADDRTGAFRPTLGRYGTKAQTVSVTAPRNKKSRGDATHFHNGLHVRRITKLNVPHLFSRPSLCSALIGWAEESAA